MSLRVIRVEPALRMNRHFPFDGWPWDIMLSDGAVYRTRPLSVSGVPSVDDLPMLGDSPVVVHMPVDWAPERPRLAIWAWGLTAREL